MIQEPAAACGGRPTRLDFLRDWLVLAAIPIPDGQSQAAALAGRHIPDEDQLRPREGERVAVGQRQLVWKKHHAPEFYLDFNHVQGRPTDYSIAFAVCYLVADRGRRDLVLKVGSDDEIAVRLNGREILRSARPRALAIDDDVIPNVCLQQGVNVLVLKVINETRDWSACARLTDASGRPVPGVRVTLAPP